MVQYTATPDYYRDYIAHYGTPGMKWGVRKQQKRELKKWRKQKRKYLKEMDKDMNNNFHSQLSKNASRVTAIGRNGYDQRDMAWNDAYRKGKVTSKDDYQIKKAAKNSREYIVKKYGEDAAKALARSKFFYNTSDDVKFEMKNIQKKKKH